MLSWHLWQHHSSHQSVSCKSLPAKFEDTLVWLSEVRKSLACNQRLSVPLTWQSMLPPKKILTQCARYVTRYRLCHSSWKYWGRPIFQLTSTYLRNSLQIHSMSPSLRFWGLWSFINQITSLVLWFCAQSYPERSSPMMSTFLLLDTICNRLRGMTHLSIQLQNDTLIDFILNGGNCRCISSLYLKRQICYFLIPFLHRCLYTKHITKSGNGTLCIGTSFLKAMLK